MKRTESETIMVVSIDRSLYRLVNKPFKKSCQGKYRHQADKDLHPILGAFFK